MLKLTLCIHRVPEISISGDLCIGILCSNSNLDLQFLETQENVQ